MADDFTIDPEIESLLPKLTAEEFETLRQLVLGGDHVDPLVILNIKDNGRVLGDGHNRKKICEGEGIPFTTRQLMMPNRAAAIQWVIDNQFGRRNLTDERRAYYRGKEYLNKKQAHGGATGNSKNGETARGQIVPLPSKTAEIIGKKHGVDARTIKRDAEYAEAVDKIGEKKGPEAKEEILSGESGKTKPEVIASVKPKKPKKQGEFICKRCKSHGYTSPRLGCSDCLAGEQKTDTPKPKPEPKPPKSGSVVFDDRLIPEAYGKLARLFNDRANARKEQKSKEYSDIRENMEKLLASWERWQLKAEK